MVKSKGSCIRHYRKRRRRSQFTDDLELLRLEHSPSAARSIRIEINQDITMADLRGASVSD
jgi:hypothetical protein